MKSITLALDAMGGDFGPSVVVPAAFDVLATDERLHLILVGDTASIASHVPANSPHQDRVTIRHTTQVVKMDELPSHAMRNKKDSSMRVAINLVKAGEAQACVSAGNTGALMATARFVLKTIPGIDRPAIIAAFPTVQDKPVRMLDLGANVDSDAERLVQFARMGSELAIAVDNLEAPKVGLLNIGEEEIKGNNRVKEASLLLLDEPNLNYIGYVEGDEIYSGNVDVVVCDGFVGNAALKTSEGMAKLIAHYIRVSFMANPLSRLVGLLAKPVLASLRKKIDPARYNGASLVGLQGIVVKSHGGTSRLGFGYAIRQALLEVEKDIPTRISQGNHHDF